MKFFIMQYKINKLLLQPTYYLMTFNIHFPPDNGNVEPNYWWDVGVTNKIQSLAPNSRNYESAQEYLLFEATHDAIIIRG